MLRHCLVCLPGSLPLAALAAGAAPAAPNPRAALREDGDLLLGGCFAVKRYDVGQLR